MSVFTFIDRISLLLDSRAILKLMGKLQKCPVADRAGLCSQIEKKLDVLFDKGSNLTEASLTVIIRVNGENHDLYSFMGVVKERLHYFKNL